MPPANPLFFCKFAFTAMISEELNVPESVADFMEGRVPKKVSQGTIQNCLGRLMVTTQNLKYLANLRGEGVFE